MFKSLAEAEAITGPLSKPSKMPGYAYGLPAVKCITGSALHKVAGSVCEKCYALKGRYIFPNVQKAQFKRLFSITHPRWVEAMAFQINKRKCDYFRWHDSGDIQSLDHLDRIAQVCALCPDTKFWLPTREVNFVKQYQQPIPSNLVIRLSAAMINGNHHLWSRNTSTVVDDPLRATCHASVESTSCGSCRSCWDPNVQNVSYKRH